LPCLPNLAIDAISRRPQAPTGKLAPIKRFHARPDSSDSDDHRNDMDDDEGDSDLDRTLVQQASSPGPSKVVSLEDAAADRALIVRGWAGARRSR
jgi:hypothetical protein